MINRLRNLWRLSEFKPEHSDKGLSPETLTLRRDIERKPQKRLATIVEDKPDLFPEQEPENI